MYTHLLSPIAAALLCRPITAKPSNIPSPTTMGTSSRGIAVIGIGARPGRDNVGNDRSRLWPIREGGLREPTADGTKAHALDMTVDAAHSSRLKERADIDPP
jgi:hypothetical protein